MWSAPPSQNKPIPPADFAPRAWHPLLLSVCLCLPLPGLDSPDLAFPRELDTYSNLVSINTLTSPSRTPPLAPPLLLIMSKTAAQEEFDDLLAKNAADPDDNIHPEDRDDVARERALHERDNSDDEEESYLAAKLDEAMRMPGTYDSRAAEVKLPPASFDAGRATGVKGVIADARNYENARKSKWSEKMRSARRSVIGLTSIKSSHDVKNSDSEQSGEEDEEHFLRQWRESRRRELESEDRSRVRNRRTSPSVRTYGRFEEVDALGYLDAIEKVSRDTTVVVFVYDQEVRVTAASYV